MRIVRELVFLQSTVGDFFCTFVKHGREHDGIVIFFEDADRQEIDSLRFSRSFQARITNSAVPRAHTTPFARPADLR